jgi:hypothetical protein
MRHSEGFKLVEARFPNYHAADNMEEANRNQHQIGGVAGRRLSCDGSDRVMCERSRRVSLAWSLRWQDDVLLKYDVEFSPENTYLKGIMLLQRSMAKISFHSRSIHLIAYSSCR